MALIEELDKQGNFLFRWRSYIPGFILLLCLYSLSNYKFLEDSYELNLYYAAGCFFVSLLGLAVRCFVIGYAPARTSGRNTKEQVADVVNQEGIYSLVRHPLYLGNFLLYLGPVLYFRDIPLLLVFALFFGFYYERIMFAEEKFLRDKFGEAYLSWANRIPAFLPKFSGYVRPKLSFSFRNILKREYPSLFGIVVIFVLFDFGASFLNGFHSWQEPWEAITLPQIWVFGIGAGFYIVTRIIVKTTKLLQVEGR
ncbi:lipid A Kdo2 1-phosphate O-methyltransferase [Leptospira wolffii]|uniref:Lipid A Kdo2 1-phosphate O-methyltransferase n=1 Tax=Leptospira wolffii TaxID=409998 RepID=A0A2M9ZDK9_9LEPT|nr:lipid A Kdo2 1-phosphate O-methyltransferase [Leptospira wolffii]EPG68219.1 phospholipid methyltransferase [Leptospira wolffii serovar Khorat str. Khorat-H2]PJZ66417.1 lipid A Kdo2 1-phosphate O-methyltransferase [Leptospira wolffii]TGK60017.1 lipid A Kdo2 1-phosphate O-methyltransferase [Leptospira wolffii]TGK72361.1 lipid A Kdo2 1-phosphate O-methyltransferase [Leptospira wolffii]TGK76024.1 lipid A Kdo2 1-phosphate O-methyltransferase [Leptospira wolffii]